MILPIVITTIRTGKRMSVVNAPSVPAFTSFIKFQKNIPKRAIEIRNPINGSMKFALISFLSIKLAKAITANNKRNIELAN